MEEAAPSSDRYVMSDQLLARKTHHPSVEIEERTSTLTSPLYWREVLHSYFVEDAGDIKIVLGRSQEVECHASTIPHSTVGPSCNDLPGNSRLRPEATSRFLPVAELLFSLPGPLRVFRGSVRRV